MRDNNDLVKVRITMYAIADLDMERVEADPYWHWITEQVDVSDPKVREQALFQYLTDHVKREELFSHRPVFGTNGPSELYVTNLEVVAHGYGNADQPSEPGVHREDAAGLPGKG